jgi:hypothetical protein
LRLVQETGALEYIYKDFKKEFDIMKNRKEDEDKTIFTCSPTNLQLISMVSFDKIIQAEEKPLEFEKDIIDATLNNLTLEASFIHLKSSVEIEMPLKSKIYEIPYQRQKISESLKKRINETSTEHFKLRPSNPLIPDKFDIVLDNEKESKTYKRIIRSEKHHVWFKKDKSEEKVALS